MYFELVRKSFMQQFTYRMNSFLKILNSFIFLFVTICVWKALYTNKSVVDGIKLQEMITYVVVVQTLQILVKLPVSNYVGNRVITGVISIDFIRPVNLKYCAIADSLGIVLFNFLLTGLPMLFLGSLLWGIIIPTQFYQYIYAGVSVVLAMILYSILEYIMGITTFWTKTTFHIQWIIGAFYTLFSGASIPLWFYPEPIRIIANLLPFRFFAFEPVNIFLGKVSKMEAINILISQSIWIFILCIIEYILWNKAQKVITIQGG